MKILKYILVFLLLGLQFLTAQEETLENDEIEVNDGSRYFEDQFYFGLTYNILLNRPSGVSQNNFSNGIQLGYIKDMPINSRRNVGFGLGLGLAKNSYFSNLRALEGSNGEHVYDIIGSDVSYRRNKIIDYLVEIPFEFRYRSSTAVSYKFWRVYGGIKLSYAFSSVSKYVTADEKVRFKNNDIEELQYGAYFSFGFNTWNFYGYYQLNDLFKNTTRIGVSGEQIQMTPVRIGLMFYIL